MGVEVIDMLNLFGVSLASNWSRGMFKVGQCDRCGSCCCYTPLFNSLTDVEKAFFRMHDKKAEEVLSGQIDGHCKNLILVDGTSICKIYEDRPRFCQLYPMSPEDIIEECCIGFITSDVFSQKISL